MTHSIIRETRPVLCSFESRRAEEMASLIERQHATPLIAPSMQEIPIEDNPEALQAIRKIIAGDFPWVVLMTGVGTEALIDVAETAGLREALIEALTRTSILIRGPKPAAVLSRLGLKYRVRAPEPNTWRELIAAIDQASLDLSGGDVAVQEYGLPNTAFYEALANRGARVTPVPVYRWALPNDTGPLRSALVRIASREVDAILFTSANQVTNVLSVAEQSGVLDAFRDALVHRTLVGSIGPTCTEALLDRGLPVHAEASPPKMAQLIRTVMEKLAAER